MSQTLTEERSISIKTDDDAATDRDAASSQTGRPQQEFETEDEPLDPSVEDESIYPTGRKFQIILLSMSMVLIASDMDVSIVSVSIPAITNHFHTMADVGWYSAAYRLAKCSFQFLFGKLYKMFSLKWVFLISIAISLLGSVLCSAASTSAMFVLGRAICGLAGAGITSGCYALLVQSLPLRKRPMYASILAAMEGVSTVSAPTIGGVIVEKINWRWCFALPGLLGMVTLIIMTVLLEDVQIPEQTSLKQKVKELDIIGNLVFLPSLTCLFTALSLAGTKYPWNSPIIIAMFCLFAFLLTIFGIDQWLKGETATLPPRVLKNRSVLSALAYSLCCNSTMNVVEYYLPTYFQVMRGYSPTRSGLLMFPIIIGMLLSMLMQGFGVRAFGYYVPFMLAGSILMPIFSGLMTTLTVTTALSTVIVYSGFFGAAIGIGFQAPQVAVQNTLPAKDVHTGLAIILFAQNFGPAISVALAQSIFQNKLADNVGDILPDMGQAKIANTGLGDWRDLVGPQKLDELLGAFDLSLMQTWYLAVGLACTTVIGSSTMQWRSVKKKRT